MTQKVSVEPILSSTEDTHLSKHFCAFSLLVSFFIALFGIAVLLVAVNMNKSSDTLSMSLLVVGVGMILLALYRFLWKSRRVVYTSTGSPVTEGSCYMDSEDLSEIGRIIETKTFSLSSRRAFKQNGNGRLDYLISKDRRFAAVQLFRFIPYTYEPASTIHYYHDEEAVAFARYIGIKSK